jgi:DNA replication and repair protein RecF
MDHSVSLTRLSLTDFRSYADALIEPGPAMVVLTGDNGAGKTNVLEAISLLSPGRGLRGASLSEMSRKQGPGAFAVAARLASETDIGTGTSPGSPERRQVRINGATASAISLAEWLSILWLVPAMDRLFTESAGGRRRFLDRLVLALEPGHASHSARYEAAMRARNKLLAEESRADPAWLSALEAAMAEHGARIAEAREHALAALAAKLEAQPEGPFARAALSLHQWRPTPADAQPALLEALRSGRDRDAAAGRTLAGPHRTDLAVTHVGKGEAAERCSTGEQKALLLSITLAHAELVAERAGKHPVLLLDEVAAHLDATRRRALFERLANWGGQVWMTGTERPLFEGADGDVTWLHVENGRIAPA